MSGVKKSKSERSKSIGRSPSRSFDLSKILKHKKKEHLNHEDSESEVEEKKDSIMEGKLEEVLEKMQTHFSSNFTILQTDVDLSQTTKIVTKNLF